MEKYLQPTYIDIRTQFEQAEEEAEEYENRMMIDVDEYAIDPDLAEQYVLINLGL